MSTNVFPIGSVVALAGQMSGNGALKQGWVLCDGTLVTPTQSYYAALDAVISSTYGASDTSIALPDYRGMFLRGVDAGTGRDPDAATRSSPRPDLSQQGNRAPAVGTVQECAWVTHTHTLTRHNDHHDTDWQQVVGSNTYDCANDTAQTRTSGATGCHEARPVNQYVYHVLKAATSSPEVIVGTVLAYAGDLSTTSAQNAMVGMGWLPCDGRALDRTSYSTLWTALGTSYGWQYASDFCIPRYDGRFFRGVTGSSSRDPEASTRTAPRPDLGDSGASGATGNAVGSVQADGMPYHTHDYPGHYTDHAIPDNQLLNSCVVSSATYGTINFSNAGTAGDTRPKNIALEYIIAYVDSSSSTASFQVPAGVVIAYAGDIDDPDTDLTGWLPCDGRALSTSEYPALFAAIGCAHGGSGSSFCVPDLRGRFVRAVDHGTGTDPGPRSAAASGGNVSGVGSYEADGLGNHTHSMTTHTGSYTVHNIFVSTSLKTDQVSDVSQSPVLADVASNTPPSGAFSSENRPLNTSVYWLIKY